MSVVACIIKHLGKTSPIGAYKADMSEDVAELVAGGMAKEAAWLQVIDEKVTNLKGEKARIEQVVADAYAGTAAGKPAASAPVAAAEEAAPADAEATSGTESLNKRHSTPKKQALTPGGSLKADTTNSKADSAVWYYQGDMGALRFTASVTVDGKPDPGADRAKAMLAQIAAAQEAGWRRANYRAGSLGTVWVFERGGDFLTRAGMENAAAGVLARPVLSEDKAGFLPMATQQFELARAFDDWLNTLPADQQDNRGVVVRKMGETPVGEWARIEDDNGGVALRYYDKGALQFRVGFSARNWGELRAYVRELAARFDQSRNASEYEIGRLISEAGREANAAGPGTQAPDGWVFSAGLTFIGSVDAEVARLNSLADGREYKAFRNGIIQRPAAEATAPASKKPEPAKTASKTPTVDAHQELFKAVRAGTATPDEFKAMYARVRDGKEAITAELNTSTKDELLKGISGQLRPGTTKGDLVGLIYTGLLRRFALGKDFGPNSYIMGNEKAYEKAKRDGLDALVEGQTVESLAEYAADAKAEFDAEIARRTALLESIKVPKTLEDFQRFMRFHGNEGKTFKEARFMLTPEQRAAYDDMAAEASRGSRKASTDADRNRISTAGQSTTGEIIATKHTRDGHDLWVVKLSDRVSKEDYGTLLAGAKRLGGNYSSYRGGGAIPGFQFRTPDAAQAFLKLAGGDKTDAQAVAAERRDAFADDRSQSATERLNEMADRLEERADESLGRDRKTNTSRRAGQAASAEAAASADKAMAKTMRNLAAAIGQGAAKFLDRVRQKVQVETLQNMLRTAQNDELRAKFPAYIDQERNKGTAPTFETADFAEFPTFTAYRSDLASLARQLLEVDGTKLIGQRLMKVADDVSAAYLEFAKANFFKVSTFSSKTGGVASFGTSAAAEAAIARSGYKGKGIAYQVKRGEWTVIMSPSEAMARNIWKGDGDKRITLDPDLGAEMVEKIGRAARRGSKVSVPWQLESAYDRRKALARMGIETPAEMRAALREFVSLREQAAAPDKVKQLERAMIGRRNDGMDFFPTPEATADEMVAAADIQPGMRVLEPSAGWGHIAERIRAAGFEPDVGEVSSDRRELLEAKGFKLVGSDFMATAAPSGFTYGDTFRAPDGKVGIMRGLGSMGSDRVRLVVDGDERTAGYYSRSDLEPIKRNGLGGAGALVPRADLERLEALPTVRGDVLSSVRSAIVFLDRGDYEGAASLMDRATRQAEFNPDALEQFSDIVDRLMAASEASYDRILMNPPFSDGRDIQHVRHAFDLLKPGGRVVAIMGESAFTNQNKRATEFREWLESVGGTEEKLPDGTFLDSDLPVNTGANARMVVIDKPGAETTTQFSRTPGTRAALAGAIEAKAAFDAVDRSSVVVDDADAYFALSQKASEARGKLAAELEAQPDDGFVLQGRGFGGRMVMLNGSAQNAGQWQLTRFDGKDEPLGDSQYTTKRKALEDFLREVEINSLQDFDGRFSRSTGRGIPMNDASAVAQAIREALPTAPQIIVHESISQAPQKLREDIREAGAENDVEAAYHDGAIHVFPQHMASVERMAFVVGHHEIRHHGLRSMLGPRLGAVLLGMHQSNPALRAAAQAKIDEGLTKSRVEAIEEALADMPVEELAKLKGWDKIVTAVRQWLRNLAAKLRRTMPNLADAIDPKTWTDRDVAAMVMRAENISRGGSGGFRTSGTVFNRDENPAWYSALADQVGKASMNAGPASGWKAMLKNWISTGKVKADEVEWSGLGEWLDMQPGKVSKAQVSEFLAANGVQVTETVLGSSGGDRMERWEARERRLLAEMPMRELQEAASYYGDDRADLIDRAIEQQRQYFDGHQDDILADGGTKYDRYQLPGGTNYREVLLTLPDIRAPFAEPRPEPLAALPAKYEVIRDSAQRDGSQFGITTADEISARPLFGRHATAEAAKDAALETLNAARESNWRQKKSKHESTSTGYKSGHWDQPNIVAHIRLNDRTDADGKRVLFIEEVQSDWGQAGKKQGFIGRVEPEISGSRIIQVKKSDGVPSAPFVGKTDAWVGLALKRVIKLAADEGYSRVAFVTGEQSAERYDLSKQISAIRYGRFKDGAKYSIGVKRKGADRWDDAGLHDETTLPDVVGKEVAEKIISSGQNEGELSGLDLKVGGEGMRAFYDKIVPSVAKDVLRKLGGGAMETVDIGPSVEGRVQDRGNPDYQPLTQPGFTITDAMRDKSLGGMTMFSRASTTPNQRFTTKAVRNTIADMLGDAGAKVSWWDKTLGTQYAKAQKFPAYKRVFDQVQQYLEDASSLANDAADNAPGILPKLETWKDLKDFGMADADAKAIAGPIFAGTLNDEKVYSDAELKATHKLNDKQIGLYREYMATVNTSLDQVVAADVVRLLGDKNPALQELAITDREALREGVDSFLTDQIEKAEDDPENQQALVELRKSIREKYIKVDDLKAKGYAPLMRFGRYAVNVENPATGESMFFGLYESKSAANSMARELAGDPVFRGMPVSQGVLSSEQYKLFQAVPMESLEMFANAIGAERSAVFQEYLKLAKNNRSALKRLIKRKGTAGFSEDIPRVLASFTTSNARMASGAMNWTKAKEAIQDIRDGDIKDEAINLVEEVQNPGERAGMFRGLMFANFIGGSIASAAVNLTQPLMMTLPYLSQWGGGLKAGARLMAAGKMAASGKIGDLALSVALKRAEQDGIVSPQEIHHLTNQAMGTWGTNPYLQKAAFIWAAPFSLAEQFNRRVTFIAAYQTAKQEGLDDPFSFAEKAVTETQGLYNRGNAPNWTRNALGASALTFKQYSIHYLEWMGRMWKSGPEGKRAVGIALALLILAAGTDGLPGADDLDDLIDTLAQALGYDLNSKRARRNFVANTLGLGDQAADVAARGLSAIMGVPMDVSLRMSMGNLFPATGILLRSNTDRSRDLMEIAGPAGGLAKQYLDAGQSALRGDVGEAITAALPVALQNVLKGAGMWVNGEARDTKGAKVMETDGLDSVMKGIGFNPATIARESQKMGMIRRSEQLAKNVEGEIAADWARAIVDKDDDAKAAARQRMMDWNDDNPDARIKITMQQLVQRAKKLRESRAERFITSTSPERRTRVTEEMQ